MPAARAAQHIVHRVAHHQRLRRLDLQGVAGELQRLRIGFARARNCLRRPPRQSSRSIPDRCSRSTASCCCLLVTTASSQAQPVQLAETTGYPGIDARAAFIAAVQIGS